MSDLIKVQALRLHPDARLPERATGGASGYDLYACLPEPGYIDIGPDPVLVPTGIALAIPEGVDCQIRPRSGLTARGVGVALGTIDADYRGELKVTMWVYGTRESYRVEHGTRIAQLVFNLLANTALVQVDSLSETVRGSGGHGSTGLR